MYRPNVQVQFIQTLQDMRKGELARKEAARQFRYNTTPLTTLLNIKVEVMIQVPFGTTVNEAADEVEAVIKDVDDKGFKLLWVEGILDYPVYPGDEL